MPSMALRPLDPRLAVVLWIGLIYTTIPFVRRAREAFAARWPAEYIGYAVIVVVLAAAAGAAVVVRRQRARISIADSLWLVLVATVVVLWTRRLMGRPEEAVHFVEYGVLGVLIYRAIADSVPDATVFVAATLAGLLVGTADEIIQWLVPGRFFDFRDIVLNGGAVALVQIATVRLARHPAWPVAPSSLRLLCRLAALEVALLMLCLAATPHRLARLAEHLPLPSRLATGADAICEYGWRHVIDERTAFRSRLPLDELLRIDREHGAEAARELDAARGSLGLSRADISPLEDPFGYEIRVHLFSRNRNLITASGQVAGSDAARRHMTTAWRENLILEGVFGRTLEQTTYRWGPRRRREVEAAQDPAARWVSRAGAHLITRVSEGRLRAMMLVLLALLATCDLLITRRFRPRARPA